MNTIGEARAELARLARMLQSQQQLVEVMEQTHERFPPHVRGVTLVAGVPRKLFVNIRRAALRQPPIMIEDGSGKRWYARNVKIGDYPHPFGATMWDAEFKWTENNYALPALWIETEAQLELTL